MLYPCSKSRSALGAALQHPDTKVILARMPSVRNATTFHFETIPKPSTCISPRLPLKLSMLKIADPKSVDSRPSKLSLLRLHSLRRSVSTSVLVYNTMDGFRDEIGRMLNGIGRRLRRHRFTSPTALSSCSSSPNSRASS